MSVNFPPDVNGALNDFSFSIGFHSGIGAVFNNFVNSSQGDNSSSFIIICIIQRVKSIGRRHDARELPRIDDTGRPYSNTGRA